MKEESDLIPATPELNRLKDFLATATEPYTKEELQNASTERFERDNWYCKKCGAPLYGNAVAICDYCLSAR